MLINSAKLVQLWGTILLASVDRGGKSPWGRQFRKQAPKRNRRSFFRWWDYFPFSKWDRFNLNLQTGEFLMLKIIQM